MSQTSASASPSILRWFSLLGRGAMRKMLCSLWPGPKFSAQTAAMPSEAAARYSSALNMSNRPGCWWKLMSGLAGRPAGMSSGLMTGPEKTGPRSSWKSFRLSADTRASHQCPIGPGRRKAGRASASLHTHRARKVCGVHYASICDTLK